MPKTFEHHDDISENFKVVIKTSIIPTSAMKNSQDQHPLTTTVNKYLVSNYVRFKSSSEELRRLAVQTATFPTCSVAYHINDEVSATEKLLQEKFKESRYFCFLPMPETVILKKRMLRFLVIKGFLIKQIIKKAL